MAKFRCPTFSSLLVVDLDALRANYRAVRRHARSALCGAVVKADAYGLGADRVAAALHREGCRTFFVAQLCEALDLHAALPLDSTVVILNGLNPGSEATCADRGFVPVLNSESQVRGWRSVARARRRPLKACLQFDTGMSRLGLPSSVVRAIAQDCSFSRDVNVRLVMTHLACADEADSAANAAQLELFEDPAASFPGVPRSVAASCGIALPARYHLDLVRPGIALYGVAPPSEDIDISPVVRLRARVLQVREVETGTGVGYGLAYSASEPRRLATLALGYADGWPRALEEDGSAWFGNERLPIVGRISMDSMTIDISALPSDALGEGDLVDLVNDNRSLEEIAHRAGTIPYEILTRIGSRHARAYIEDGISTFFMPGEVR